VKKWIIIIVALILVALVVGNIVKEKRTKSIKVDFEIIGKENLIEIVSASGKLTPKRKVDVSAEVIGKVIVLNVEDGDSVVKDEILLEIDATEAKSAVRGLSAAVTTVKADLQLSIASLDKAIIDLGRVQKLIDNGLGSQEQLDAAETNRKIENARVESTRARLLQADATLASAKHNLGKVTIKAPMTGVVTRLNVEEGENAIMGTLNNPGTVLMTISDLSTMESEVKVDETEVVGIKIGQLAEVEIDAFPDSTFTAVVTEISNSPVTSGDQAVDFKVTVTLEKQIEGVRPGLSSKAEITIASVDDAIAVPIGAVTVREWPPREHKKGRHKYLDKTDDGIEREELEGVFVMKDGKAEFLPITLGITGDEHFEVITGLEDGQEIISGPFSALRDLEHGDQVKKKKKK
jgi:HlyD family secretion protein